MADAKALAGSCYAQPDWDVPNDRLWEALVAAQGELGEGLAVMELAERRFVLVNEALCQLYGYSVEELFGLANFWDVVHPDDVPKLEPAREARVAGGEGSDRRQVRIIRGDRRTIEVDVSIKPLPALPGTCVLVIVRKVTDQQRHESELAAAERRYRQLVERLPVVTYVAEPGETGKWLYVSPQIEPMFGYPRQQWIDDPTLWARLVHPDDRERVFASEERLESGERLPPTEYRMLTRSGDLIWIRDDAVVRTEAEDGMTLLDGLFADITEAKVAEARLQYLADHDPLTGLLNRRRFIEDLTLELALIGREQRESSVVVIDVDNFKYVNDSLGHHAGDQMIRSVASVLAGELRAADTIARLGGDEFAILLRGTVGERAMPVADRLIDAVREHVFEIAPEPVRVTASGGLAWLGRDGEMAEEALAAADLAMYESKRGGRDRMVTFSPELRTSAETRQSWADRIRSALADDTLLLYQQPILDLTTNEITQHELLLRMEGVDDGVIAPKDFLGVAERFDLIQAIDRWVVSRAIALIAESERSGKPRSLSMNLSGRSIGDPDLFELLERELRETGIDASRLVLEITETAAIESMEEARTFAERLAALGCHLALDDFGSGFGSFYYLKHLPLDYLKIDGDFIRHITTNPFDHAVVRSIVQMADSVGHHTVAEFVVDEPTLEAVRELGVHFAQGYYVGMPEPVP
ncbi:MAG: hypothetical protein QOJ29_4436 [Thermoleophilaceae bacterium]|nr:hypothetical protein [Thermoleophilaceae bacterium]